MSFNAVDHTIFARQISSDFSVPYNQILVMLGFCAVVHRGNALCPVLYA